MCESRNYRLFSGDSTFAISRTAAFYYAPVGRESVKIVGDQINKDGESSWGSVKKGEGQLKNMEIKSIKLGGQDWESAKKVGGSVKTVVKKVKG